MMTRNAAQLKAYLKNAAQKLGVVIIQILQNYVMERLHVSPNPDIEGILS